MQNLFMLIRLKFRINKFRINNFLRTNFRSFRITFFPQVKDVFSPIVWHIFNSFCDTSMLSSKYGDDVDVVVLREQLKFLPSTAERHQSEAQKLNISNNKCMQSLNNAQRGFISQLYVVVNLVLLSPATNYGAWKNQ